MKSWSRGSVGLLDCAVEILKIQYLLKPLSLPGVIDKKEFLRRSLGGVGKMSLIWGSRYGRR